jgi:hypothetical protein
MWKRRFENHVLADEYILPDVDSASAVQHNSEPARKYPCQKLKTSVHQTLQKPLFHSLICSWGKMFDCVAPADSGEPPQGFAASTNLPDPSRQRSFQ